MMALATNLELSTGHHQNVSNSAGSHQQVYRRILRQCVASMCHSAGFHSTQEGSLDALTILLLRFCSKTCQSSRALCEHTGRSLVNAGDIYMALLNEGRPQLANLDDFLYRTRRKKQHTFSVFSESPQKVSPILRIANPRPHPSHFPNFLPLFPEPHTYIRSEVRDETDANYESARRLDAQNKRCWEMSLVRFTLTQYPTVSVFRELDARLMFEAKDTAVLLPFDEPRSYLSALLTDDADQTVDDEQHNDYFARILSKEMDEDGDDDGGGMEAEEGGAGGTSSTAAMELGAG
uniref:Transcription initiation factor TFIID subunit 8 n=1 Tax=Globodera rostochiensis TaxID=31243 RepID=A0A914I9K9_GLORO